MGLDGVELVMALEERFGVTISDAEAEVCVTPAMVIDLIFGKVRASEERVCLSQRAFYLLRKGLIRTLGTERHHVVLRTDLRLLTCCRSKREVWGDLRNAVQARRWPALVRPPWLVAVLWIVPLGAFFGLIGAVHWAIAGASMLLIAFTGGRITQPFRSRIPGRYSQIRKLVPFAVTSDAIAWTRDQVASLVRKLVIEQLGLRENQYREEAHFVKDFGMDQ